MANVCVCVSERAQLMFPHFSQLGFSSNSGKRSSENPLEIPSLIPLSEVSSLESLHQRGDAVYVLGYAAFPFLCSASHASWCDPGIVKRWPRVRILENLSRMEDSADARSSERKRE